MNGLGYRKTSCTAAGDLNTTVGQYRGRQVLCYHLRFTSLTPWPCLTLYDKYIAYGTSVNCMIHPDMESCRFSPK